MKYLLLLVSTSCFAMQLTVKEEDVPRIRRLTESGLIKITHDICPIKNSTVDKIQDKFMTKVENIRSSPNLEAQEIMERLRFIARAYAAEENSELKKEVLNDKALLGYINGIVVQSMDEYLHEKDLTIEDLTQKQERDKYEKYIAFGCSALCTFIGVVGPIIIGSIMCGD